MIGHTKEPWEVDHRECDGIRYFVILGPDGKTILDTMNSESQLINEDVDEDGFRNQWDAQGEVDLRHAALCVNACAVIADPTAIAFALRVLEAVASVDLERLAESNKDAFGTLEHHSELAKNVLEKLKGGG
jgi:hypothetical protein